MSFAYFLKLSFGQEGGRVATAAAPSRERQGRGGQHRMLWQPLHLLSLLSLHHDARDPQPSTEEKLEDSAQKKSLLGVFEKDGIVISKYMN